jgi:tetratricopeptide (TPR) repeat protein
MAGIFISYRRKDSSGSAGRLYENLQRRFGDQQVFMDVDKIADGKNFVEVIQQHIAASSALLAVIGREWMERDAAGARRIDSPRDLVRLEIAEALKRDILVIPVLVEDAAMPSAEDLPADLQPLALRNAVELRHSRWRTDVEDFCDRLAQTLKLSDRGGDAVESRADAPLHESEPGRSSRRTAITIGAVLLIAAGSGYGGYSFYGDRQAERFLQAGIAAHYHPTEPQLEIARFDYRRAIEWRPQLAEAHYHLAHVYAYLQEPDEARKEFKRALDRRDELDPVQAKIATQQLAAFAQADEPVLVASAAPPPPPPPGAVETAPPKPVEKRGGLPYLPPTAMEAQRLQAMVEQMFAANRDTRVASTTALLLDQKTISDAVPIALSLAAQLQAARGDPARQAAIESGIINAFVLLRAASPVALRRYEEQIRALSAAARDNGEQTRKIVNQTEQRLAPAKTLRPLASLYIANESQRPIALAMAKALDAAGYDTRAIEVVGDRAPRTRTEVRSYGASDQALARWQAKKVGDFTGDEVAIATLPKRSLARDSYEVWFDQSLCSTRPKAMCGS